MYCKHCITRHAIIFCCGSSAVLQAQLQAVVQQLDLAPSICRRGEPLEVSTEAQMAVV
jgi:hypothetical protein